jgi:tripartite ATP-independent transporter DctM subunit
MRAVFWIIGILALIGTPLFALMGGASELFWLTHANPVYRHLRYIAPTVLDERFAGSPILVTIPLFTFVGYMMAESKTPDRIVQASRAFFGWMPGGLALVAIAASAFFTTLTGGSGVTIVAIGGLLYPALRKQKYPDDFSLGLVTTGGSLGLLLPPSLPILIYALVAGVDFAKAFKAALLPGLLIMVLLYAYSAYVSIKAKVPRDPLRLSTMAEALWLIKWELLIPVIILGGIMTGLTSLDESAALTALYTFVVEVFIYKDLSIKKDLPRVAMSSMSLAGAVILILAMANALINFVVQEQIPGKVLEQMVGLGLKESWQFLIVLNLFLLVLGMVMDGFSAILVAVPLVLPFAARFHLNPFHVAVMFLLNLELAFMLPPLGLNLFISSFRFNRPVVSLYRVVLPFSGLVALGLALIMYVPGISTVLLASDVAAARAAAAKTHSAPREAWQLECVQEDPTHPLPCTPEEAAIWGTAGAAPAAPQPGAEVTPAVTGEAAEEDLFQQMLGGGADAGPKVAAPAPELSDDDELFRQMLGDSGAK